MLNPDECKTLLTALAVARDTMLKVTLPALEMNAQARGPLLETICAIDELFPKIMDLRYMVGDDKTTLPTPSTSFPLGQGGSQI